MGSPRVAPTPIPSGTCLRPGRACLPDIKWGRLVAPERQPKQPSSCPDTPPTHAVPLLPVWPLTAGPRARLRRKLVTAVVTPVHRCDGCLSDRDKQAS